jgi:hypothetical protein
MPFSTVLIVFGSWVLLLVLALTVRGRAADGEEDG